MSRLTIDEVIQHCDRQVARFESFSGREKCENWDTESNYGKEYWEHRQVKDWLQQLQEYRNAASSGKMIILPCDIGDTIYVNLSSSGNRVYVEAEVRDFTYFHSCGFCVVVTSKHFDKQAIPFSKFGSAVFRTKEEADAYVVS